MDEREDLISFFVNISGHHLRELFDIIHELVHVIQYETESEEQTMEMFRAVLWKATSGYDMVMDGKNRPLPEDYDE